MKLQVEAIQMGAVDEALVIRAAISGTSPEIVDMLHQYVYKITGKGYVHGGLPSEASRSMKVIINGKIVLVKHGDTLGKKLPKASTCHNIQDVCKLSLVHRACQIGKI
jgi:hypothetical protein